MIITRVILSNWRNFRTVDVKLGDRVFVAGPNASGKSNFLDVFRFLRDLCAKSGGLQEAIDSRGGVSKIRCLAARKNPTIEIEVHFGDVGSSEPTWKYSIGIMQEQRGNHRPILSHERVWEGNQLVLNRPDGDDKSDEMRKTQTHIEQINANQKFRDIYNHLNSVMYLHLIPQLVRHSEAFGGRKLPGDPFGRGFLELLAATPPKTRQSRLTKIEKALKAAIPQLNHLTYTTDEKGVPHLESVYQHWRPHGARQREDQFSDGTLRLIALLWTFLEGDSLLLLEEPELSLNAEIVKKIPSLIHQLQRSKKKKQERQVILTTHSSDLLSSREIGGEEVLLLNPDSEGTTVRLASGVDEIRRLLESGQSIADAALPHINPQSVEQLDWLDQLFNQ